MHTHGRTAARARFPRYYLAISILLSEQCICSRRRKVFDESRAAAGAYNARWALHVLFMHMYAYRMRTRADGRTRNGTLATGRERPDISTCSSRSAFTAWVPLPRVGDGPLTSSNGGARGNLSPKVLPRAVYGPMRVNDTQLGTDETGTLL